MILTPLSTFAWNEGMSHSMGAPLAVVSGKKDPESSPAENRSRRSADVLAENPMIHSMACTMVLMWSDFKHGIHDLEAVHFHELLAGHIFAQVLEEAAHESEKACMVSDVGAVYMNRCTMSVKSSICGYRNSSAFSKRHGPV